ncbi:hypothetical protein MMYC01_201939 [Madurella mycetomatis]|uniref:Heterokaryon incompatibility domain-containing protein n=1 Tax=Madurella mycetomatis TaxID=100816 RepID=A0A175WCP8_9PEZI|nr:hypothetical protein MMYC01_201939 [Madurella mycetomatis]
MLDGIPLQNLPKTFRDGIYITRGLGIRYFWIDSLCIVQDDMDDWTREAAKMADIYGNSYLTLAATGSRNATEGCLFSRSVQLRRMYDGSAEVLRRQRLQATKFHASHNGTPFTVYARNFSGQAHENFTQAGSNTRTLLAPLLSRAWCFQERMISQRVVHFHKEEMVWECGTCISCECGFLQTSSDTSASSESFREQPTKLQIAQVLQNKRTKLEAFDTWRDIIRLYSSLLLTKESDRFPALAGLAVRFCSVLNCGYLAGFLDEDIPRALLWVTTVSPDDVYRASGNESEEVPTWSWASILYRRFFRNERPFIGSAYVLQTGGKFNTDHRFRIVAVQGKPDNAYMTGSGVTLRY